jgi:hypothetical protein
MPKVSANYLLEEARKIGLSSSGGMSLQPMTWQDVYCYKNVTESSLHPWECECLIEVSRHYVRSYNSASDNKMPPPYVTDDPDELQQHAEWVARNDDELSRQ